MQKISGHEMIANNINRISLSFILIFLLFISSNAQSQLKPSIYIGTGFGTNLGGIVGVGGEIQYKFASFNVAVGNLLGKSLPQYHTGDKSRFDYDLGLKLYTKFGLFGGVNYGLIEASSDGWGERGEKLHFEKTHGFSFTLGYRHTIYKHIYGLTYLGATSNKKANTFQIPWEKKSFFPRIGLIIGYEFNSISLGK
jgi:hypothetical protein